MKKTFAAVFSAVLLCASFFGCKSARQIDIADYSPIAVVSVYSNSSVPWYVKNSGRNTDESTTAGGLISSDLNKFIEKDNPEYKTVQERIDQAAEILIAALEENGVSVKSREALHESDVYKSSFNKFMQDADTWTNADGFMALDYSGKSRNRKIASQTGAGGTMFAEFIFQKEKVQDGFFDSRVAARVTLKVYVADAEGEKVLYKTYSGISPDSVDYKNGAWERDVVVGYFPGVIESVVNRFIMDYTGHVPENASGSSSGKETESTSLSQSIMHGNQ